jgi:hypothetical protein
MRHWLLLIVVTSLSACSEEQLVDCKIAEQEVFACTGRFVQRTGSDFFEECVPMTEPQRFHGTWATDFEFNEFYSGKVVAAEDAWQFPEPTTRLWGDPLEKYERDGLANVLEVEFVGRRPICNFTEPVRDIIVDELIHVRVIDQRPSKW